MRVAFSGLLAALLLLSAATSVRAQKLPLDLYIIVDQSGSIGFPAANNICRQGSHGLSCWQVISRFVDAIQSRMAALAGGYANSPDAPNDPGGLRLSVFSFSCRTAGTTMIPITHTWISGPTGNATAIEIGLALLAAQSPGGQTCPSGAFQDVLAEMVKAGPDGRPSAVIELTDGNIDKQNAGKTLAAANGIRNQTGANMFAIALGKGGAGAHNELLNIVGGDPSHVLSASDANALDSLASVLSAVMLGSLQMTLQPSQAQLAEARPFTQAAGAVCLGANATVALSGKTVKLLGAAGLECSFAGTVVQPVQVSADTVTCTRASGNFTFWAKGAADFQNLTLVVSIVNGNQRRPLYKADLAMRVVPCIAVQFLGDLDNSNCFPQVAQTGSGFLQLTGPTLAYAPANSKFTCSFGSGLFSVATANASGSGALDCVAPSVDVVQALVKGESPTPFAGFILSLGSTTLLTRATSIAFDPHICVAAASSVTQWCWALFDGVPAVSWSGTTLSSVETVASGAGVGLEFSCVYQVEGMTDQVQVSASAAQDGSVACDRVPGSMVFEMRTLYASNVSLDATLQARASGGNASRGWWAVDTQTVDILVSPCLTVAQGPDSSCAGENVTLIISGPGMDNLVNVILRGQASLAATCRVGSVSATVEVPALITAQNVTCIFPTDLTTQFLTYLTVGSSGVDVFISPEFETAVNVCVFAGLPSSACWGDVLGGIALTGLSVPTTPAQCVFNVSGQFLGTSAFASGSCAFPAGLTDLSPFDWQELSLALQLPSNQLAVVLNVTQFRLDSCFSRVLDLPALPGLPSCAPDCCLRSVVSAAFTGPGAGALSASGSCEFVDANGTLLADLPVALNGSQLDCSIHAWIPFQPSVLPAGLSVAFQGLSVGIEANFSSSPVPCVSLQVQSPRVVLGQSAVFQLAGPTLSSDVLQAFDLLCVVQSGNSSTNLAASGSSCSTDALYASLAADASLSVFLASRSDASSRARRLRGLKTSGTGNARLALISATPLGGLFSVGTQLDHSSVTPQCVLATSAVVSVSLSGPGAPVLAPGSMCRFEPSSANASTVHVAMTFNGTSAVCASAMGPGAVSVDFLGNNNLTFQVLPATSVPLCLGATLAPSDSAGAAAAATLSGGAVAGIVIAAIAACVLVLILAVFLLRQKRKKPQRAPAGGNNSSAARELKGGEAGALPQQEGGPASASGAAPASGLPPREDAPAIELASVVAATTAAAAAGGRTSPGPGLVVVELPQVFRPGQLVERELPSGAWRRGVIKEALPGGGDFYALTDLDKVHASTLRPARSDFEVGEWVQARLDGGEEWVSAVVQGVLDDDMYALDASTAGPVSSAVLRRHVYAVGDAVEVMLDSGTWVEAVVSRLDPICVVGRDEPVKNIRPAPFAEGHHVEERGSDGEWRPAVVVAALPGDMFELDGAGGVGLQRPRHRIRWPRYAGGDTVQVRRDDGEWVNAVVVAAESRSLVALVQGSVDPKRFAMPSVRPFLRIMPLDTSVMGDDDEESHVASGLDVSMSGRKLKYKTRAPLDFAELPNNCFEITVDKAQGLGVSLGWTKQQTIVVTAFRLLQNRDWGPLEACELVGLRDQLLAVNGASVGGRSFGEVADMIRGSPDRITLKFGRPTVARLDVQVV